jgi:hypothetical protein
LDVAGGTILAHSPTPNEIYDTTSASITQAIKDYHGIVLDNNKSIFHLPSSLRHAKFITTDRNILLLSFPIRTPTTTAKAFSLVMIL